jgi:hypothetical protein
VTVVMPGWRPLDDAPQAALVLACDFDGGARSGATFDDLVRMLPGGSGYHVCVSRPPRPGDLERRENLLSSLTRDVDRWAVHVHAVLGYCAGSVLARALADRIEAIRGYRPIVVLLDPMAPSLAMFHDDFSEAVRSMTGIGHAEAREFLDRAEAVLGVEPESFHEGIGQIAAVYLEACVLNFKRLGVDSSIAEELAEVFASYGSYLTSAAEMTVDGAQWDRCVVVASRRLAASASGSYDVDVDPDRLLADPRSVGIVARALRGELS